MTLFGIILTAANHFVEATSQVYIPVGLVLYSSEAVSVIAPDSVLNFKISVAGFHVDTQSFQVDSENR